MWLELHEDQMGGGRNRAEGGTGRSVRQGLGCCGEVRHSGQPLEGRVERVMGSNLFI